MPNALYPYGKAEMMRGAINLVSDTIVAYLVDGADYTYSSAHKFLSDVAAIGRVDSFTLASKTVSDAGVFDAADGSFAAATGDPSEIIILVKDTGVAATSQLILYYDTGVTGLPVTPNGGDINVTWDATGIFLL